MMRRFEPTLTTPESAVESLQFCGKPEERALYAFCSAAQAVCLHFY